MYSRHAYFCMSGTAIILSEEDRIFHSGALYCRQLCIYPVLIRVLFVLEKKRDYGKE